MNVLHYGPNPPSGTLPLALFARGLYAAELDKRLAARLGSGQPRSNLRSDGLLQMELNLVVQFAALLPENEEA
jgi:hypothetical protein